MLQTSKVVSTTLMKNMELDLKGQLKFLVSKEDQALHLFGEAKAFNRKQLSKEVLETAGTYHPYQPLQRLHLELRVSLLTLSTQKMVLSRSFFGLLEKNKR